MTDALTLARSEIERPQGEIARLRASSDWKHMAADYLMGLHALQANSPAAHNYFLCAAQDLRATEGQPARLRDAGTAHADLVASLRASADEVESFPHPSHCDHLHVAFKVMREAANALAAAPPPPGAEPDGAGEPPSTMLASWDEKALEIAHQIVVRHWCDSRPEGRTSRLQVAVLEAMQWASHTDHFGDANKMVAALEALEGVLPYMEAAETAGLVGDEGCHWPVEAVRAAIALLRPAAAASSPAEPVQPQAPQWAALYKAANEAMAVLGAHGTISARDDRVQAVMDALHAIDSAAVQPQALSLEDCPELNLSNYDADDVARLNDWAIRADAEIQRLTKRAAPIGARAGFAQHLLAAAASPDRAPEPQP